MCRTLIGRIFAVAKFEHKSALEYSERLRLTLTETVIAGSEIQVPVDQELEIVPRIRILW